MSSKIDPERLRAVSNQPLRVGDYLYGYCEGIWGRDGYDDKRVEAIGADWVVVRCVQGRVFTYVGDPEELRQYREDTREI